VIDSIATFLGNLLSILFQFLPSLGWSIIALTVIINVLVFPLTLRQTRSMRASAELQPEIKRIQAEHKDDKVKQQEELMALYKEKGVHPLGGCLPSLVQLPVWYGLFRLLRSFSESDEPATRFVNGNLADAIEAGETTFWGMDLTAVPSAIIPQDFVAGIPYLILIVAIVATGFYSQRLQMARRGSNQNDPNASSQAQQIQAILKYMPLMFGVIGFTLPAGVSFYIATGQLVRMGGQELIDVLEGPDPRSSKAGNGNGDGPAAVDEKPATDVEVKKKPQGSKKKQNRRRRS
jgi:YidC/Oxa1 family membrane protein insertase